MGRWGTTPTSRCACASNSHGARPVHLIITMIKWIRTSRLSIKKSLSAGGGPHLPRGARALPRPGRSSSSLLLSSVELNDTTVYEPQIRARLGTASHPLRPRPGRSTPSAVSIPFTYWSYWSLNDQSTAATHVGCPWTLRCRFTNGTVSSPPCHANMVYGFERDAAREDGETRSLHCSSYTSMLGDI